MAHSEKQQAQQSALEDFVAFASNRREEIGSLSEEMEAVVSKAEQALSLRDPDSVYTPVVQLADLVGISHDSLPREELIRRVAQAALDEVTRLRRQAEDAALELREISRQMLVAGGEFPSLYQISHKLAHYSPPGVGREAGERLSYQAQRLDKGLRAIYEKLEKKPC